MRSGCAYGDADEGTYTTNRYAHAGCRTRYGHSNQSPRCSSHADACYGTSYANGYSETRSEGSAERGS